MRMGAAIVDGGVLESVDLGTAEEALAAAVHAPGCGGAGPRPNGGGTGAAERVADLPAGDELAVADDGAVLGVRGDEIGLPAGTGGGGAGRDGIRSGASRSPALPSSSGPASGRSRPATWAAMPMDAG